MKVLVSLKFIQLWTKFLIRIFLFSQIIFTIIAVATLSSALPAKPEFQVLLNHDPNQHVVAIPQENHRRILQQQTIKPVLNSGQLDHHGKKQHAHDYFAHPKYEFEYGVKDSHTGDHKTHWEVRDGDSVKGEYTVEEADGTIRVVKYTSDGNNGFQAVVEKIGKAKHPNHPNQQQKN